MPNVRPFREPPPTFPVMLTERQGRAVIRAVGFAVRRVPECEPDHADLVAAVGAVSAAIPQRTSDPES